MPKVSFTSALPVGTESIHETVDIELYDTVTITRAKEKIIRELPNGISLLHIEDISRERKKSCLTESHFRITMNGIKIG